MTLKEKFEIATDGWIVTDKCVKLSDNYAIGFADWISENQFTNFSNSLWYSEIDKGFKTKELLEIYKKEKGL